LGQEIRRGEPSRHRNRRQSRRGTAWVVVLPKKGVRKNVKAWYRGEGTVDTNGQHGTRHGSAIAPDPRGENNKIKNRGGGRR